jgi:hypothetical protein
MPIPALAAEKADAAAAATLWTERSRIARSASADR